MSNKRNPFTASEYAAAGILSFAYAVIIGIITTLCAPIGIGALMLTAWPLLLAVYDYDRIMGDGDNGDD